MPQFLRSLVLMCNAENVCAVTLCRNVVDLAPELEIVCWNACEMMGVYIHLYVFNGDGCFVGWNL